MERFLLGAFLLAGAIFTAANRAKFRDDLWRYYQKIYQPTGPWWRNGAWRPSARLTGLMVDAFTLIVVVLAVFELANL
jgi:hypothetical protein